MGEVASPEAPVVAPLQQLSAPSDGGQAPDAGDFLMGEVASPELPTLNTQQPIVVTPDAGEAPDAGDFLMGAPAEDPGVP